MEERKLGTGFLLNPLVEAQRDFSVMETRIFYLGLQDINPHITEKDKYYDDKFPDTVITPSELAEIFGHTQYITEVDKATDNLIGKYIAVRFNDGFDKYTIFQHIRYKKDKGLFIKFNEDMRPFILDIYETYKTYGFTKIEMQQIFYLGSTYAMRILELLLKYKATAKKGIIEREITIKELREKLNVPDNAYKNRINNFKQKVLDLPIKDINKNTKYNVTYDVVKSGRNVVGFRLYCNCNKVTKDDDYKTTIEAEEIAKEPLEEKLEREAGQGIMIEYPKEKTPDLKRGLTDEEKEMFDRLINRDITPKKAKSLIKTYDLQRIDRNLKKAVQQKDNSRNLGGLIISFIEEDTAGQMKIAQKEAKAREEEKRKDYLQAYEMFHGNRPQANPGTPTATSVKADELSQVEAELVKISGKATGKVAEKMKKLGLTIEDVKKGKRK